MTLGVKLNTYIEQLGEKQAAVAMAWLELWKQRASGNKSWSPSTISSQLNRLVKDQEQGLRFFFQDRTRGALLFEVLRVPEAELPALFDLAEQALKSEGAPARIIIDATGWRWSVEKADVLFAELKRLLIMEGPYPITLLILEDQYDKLPRSFDPLMNKEKLRYQEVKTPEQGWERAQELAEEQGLVLSARQFPEFERWLAADFDGRTLLIEPTNGLELFRTQGRLPSLEPVTHDLAELVPKQYAYRSSLPEFSCEQHRLMRALRSEEDSAGLKLNASIRQGMALALGITATSTSRERTEAQIGALTRELPVELTQGSATDLQNRLEQARRRRTGPLALWVDDTVHLLNVPEAARLAANRPFIRTHDIQPDPTPLSRLLEAVAEWSEFDFLSDPFLEHLIARLDPEEKQRTAFLHARAGLLLTQALRPKARTPVTDWKPVLEELLANDPPAALLRVHLRGKQIDYAGQKRLPFPITQARVKQLEKASNPQLQQVPPVGDLLLSRQEELLVVTEKDVQREDWDYAQKAPGILLPNAPETARDSEFWLDVYEACDFTAEAWSRKRPDIWQKKTSLLIPGYLKHWKMGRFDISPEVWEEADRELAMVWLALRMALLNPQTIRLPDGAVLLRLGGPFFAEIRINPPAHRTDPAPIQASLQLDIDFEDLRIYADYTTKVLGQVSGVSDLITTHTVKGGYDFGARLPKRIHLLGERYCADIRFRGSALFSEASQALPSAAIARIEDEKQKAAAAQNDDDD
ncbi:hypothetical protein [Archangium violaceum]|uniref:Uncharacterized protein n=1 Tax=Archangium violaceum Cb vi76 TaxID=1406225 RepID=A0A084SQZ4_9BACT|nr:hypothetical protein [Archangium violaceum]KFA90879.1 hypothetical protein Q664_25770 [Archangium violaceum Cb vi76]